MKKRITRIPKKKRVMAVVRGGHPRMPEIFFYAHFEDLRIRFIGDKTTGWVVEEKIPPNIEYQHLPLKPAWIFDPVTFLLGKAHAHRSWQYVSGLENYLRDVDVINISDCFYFYCGQCARLAKKLGKKLVSIVWENVPHHPSTYLPPYSFQVRSVIENADLFIARSKKARDYLISIGADPKKVQVIYKGISMKDFHPNSSLRTEKIRLLYVGQLVESKGINELLEAFRSLSLEFRNLELWICAPSKGEPLEKKIENLSKSHPIVWLGSLPYDKIPEVYRQCHIYCQLSQDWKYLGILPGGNDWFPYSVIEAMASGLPVVATSVGGIPEQLGEGNILVEQKDIESAYLGIKRFIEDEGLRKKVGALNRKRAELLFDIERQAKKTEEAILEII